MNNQNGTINSVGLAAIIMSLLFVGSTASGIWAFMGRQSYKNDSDEKVTLAVEAAKKETAAAKDAEFEQTSKQPTEAFSGAETYGSLKFNYPRTWSAYVESSTGATPLNATFHPSFVSNSKDIAHALRVQVVEEPYDEVVADFDSDIKKGTVTAVAFTPKLVPTALGLRFSGEVISKKTGVMIVLPLRDNTIKIWTESNEFVADLDTFVLESLSYQP